VRTGFKRGLAVTAVVLAGAFGVQWGSGIANASVGPVQYTPAGADSISGYYAHAVNDTIDFSNLTTYMGTDGQDTLAQLPVSTVTGTVSIGGAAGIGLCNQDSGNAAQLGAVNVGGGKTDIVDATGFFTAGNNNDLCQGGIVNPDGVNGTVAGKKATFGVLAGPFSDTDTVVLNVLYDPHAAYTFKGKHHAAGTITFAVTDLSAPGVSYQASVSAPGKVFDEADAGAIADTQTLVPLSGTPPYLNPGVNGNLNADPQLLEGFSHTQFSGNTEVPGGPEYHGSFYSSPVVTAFPVASSANSKTYLGPTVFSEDHFLELVGSPVS
jgi:hypothetical protein